MKMTSSSGGAHHTGRGGKKADEGEINLEELLNDLSRDILKIYKTTLNPHADLHTRNPLDLLTEIESYLEGYMREIEYIEALDPQEVNAEERNCKVEFKKHQREEFVRVEQEQNEAKNRELRARMDRVVTKVGKPTVPRSTKKRIKKQVVEVKVDEDRVDFIKYLGEDFAGVTGGGTNT